MAEKKDALVGRTTTACIKAGKGTVGKGTRYPKLKEWHDGKERIYVGRHIMFSNVPGSKFGNPFGLSEYQLNMSLRMYRNHLRHCTEYHPAAKCDADDPRAAPRKDKPTLDAQARAELRGCVLGCMCEQKPGRLVCHAQILAEIANGPPAPL